MYRREDGGRLWGSIEAGLPSTFGFPAAVHPRDPATLYLLPLNGDTAGRYVPVAKDACWRPRDGGGGWVCLRRGPVQGKPSYGVILSPLPHLLLSPSVLQSDIHPHS